MKDRMKKLLVVLVILSTMATAVNAGNIGPAIQNVVRTLGIEDIVTIAITSPPSDSARYGNASVSVGYTITNASSSDIVNYSLNGALMAPVLGGNPFIVTGVDIGTDNGTLNNVTLNVTGANGTAQAFREFKVDITSPANITNITSTKGTNYVNWTWINPTNTDFNNTIVNVTNATSIVVPDTKLPKEINYFNATGLSPNTEYTISVKTEDDAPAP